MSVPINEINPAKLRRKGLTMTTMFFQEQEILDMLAGNKLKPIKRFKVIINEESKD